MHIRTGRPSSPRDRADWGVLFFTPLDYNYTIWARCLPLPRPTRALGRNALCPLPVCALPTTGEVSLFDKSLSSPCLGFSMITLGCMKEILFECDTATC